MCALIRSRNNTVLHSQDLRPSVNGSNEDIHNSASDNKIDRFIRVPNDLIGRVLAEKGNRSAALALLTISLRGRASKPNFALNETHCRKFGIKRAVFQAGLRLLKTAGVLLEREPRGRAFATETWAEGSEGYTPLPESLLRRHDPKLLGFVLTARLQPAPIQPSKIAERLGYTAKGTARRLAQEAIKHGYLAASTGPNGEALVGRMTAGDTSRGGATSVGATSEYIRKNAEFDQHVAAGATTEGAASEGVVKKSPSKNRPHIRERNHFT